MWVVRKFFPQIKLELDPDNPIKLYQEYLEKQVVDGEVYCRIAGSNDVWQIGRAHV